MEHGLGLGVGPRFGRRVALPIGLAHKPGAVAAGGEKARETAGCDCGDCVREPAPAETVGNAAGGWGGGQRRGEHRMWLLALDWESEPAVSTSTPGTVTATWTDSARRLPRLVKLVVVD